MPKFRTWTLEERAWALECASAGDSFDEIGAELDCPDHFEVWARLNVQRPMSGAQRELASLYAAGTTTVIIAETVFPGKRSGRQLVYSHVMRLRRWGYVIPGRPAGRPTIGADSRPAVRSYGALPQRQSRNLQIAEVLGSGLSAGEIARRFKTTRNVVLGVAYRARQTQPSLQAAHG